jgi:hypothetical protein
MNGSPTLLAWASSAMSGLLSVALAYGAENPGGTGKVYSLEEVSVFDYTGPARSELQSGQPTTDCGDAPAEGVAYPAFQSKKPIYGTVLFDLSLFDPRAGLRYYFAIDESAGAGYDRLYFDVNHDSDLTNDAAVGLAKDPPAGLGNMPGSVLFENLRVNLDYGPGHGVFAQTVMPRLMKSGENAYVFFTAPTARKGKIQLGSQEVELVLGQVHTITGRYDGPMTGAFLTGTEEAPPFLGYWRFMNGTFHRLSATPAGDKVTVAPYAGPFGVLETGTGGRNMAPPTIEFGWISSRDAFLDIGDCSRKDGKLSLPVGDYRPFRMAVRYGQRRLGLSVDTAQLGRNDAPVVFPLTIRQDKPFVLDFSEKPEVVFKNPPAGNRLKTGQMVSVEATLCDVRTGTMIAALEDTTKKTGSTKLPNGRDLDMFESVAPAVKITNSSGQTVAEGSMPFG